MFFGTLTAIGHGIALPLLMLVFGEQIDIFIYQEQSSLAASCLNVSRNCMEEFTLMPDQFQCFNESENFNLTAFMMDPARLTLDESVRIIFGDTARCLTDGEFKDEVIIFSIYFVVIAVVAFVFGYLEISFYQMACERQVRKIRLEFYRAILRQNIGWFDSNPSGELASRLNE